MWSAAVRLLRARPLTDVRDAKALIRSEAGHYAGTHPLDGVAPMNSQASTSPTETRSLSVHVRSCVRQRALSFDATGIR